MTDGIELHLGDCLDVLRGMPGGCVDAVVTDPPYGIVNKFGVLQGEPGKGPRKLEFDWDSPDGVPIRLDTALASCKPSAAVFVFTSIDIVGDLLPLARSRGFTVKPAVWVKKYPPPAGKGNWWPSGFELAFYGYRKSPFFGDSNDKRSNVFVSDSMRHGQPGKCGHPTQKPLGLVRKIVESIVPPGGICLDPYMGSGTTGVACVQTGRKFIGIELDPNYFAIAKRRIEEAAAMPLFDGAPTGEKVKP